MLDVLAQDYIRTAQAKGLAPGAVLIGHALKNAAVPIVTVIGIGIALLIGGAIVTETVFAIPGIGRLTVDAILRRDYPIIQGVILLFSGVYVLINLRSTCPTCCSIRASATDMTAAALDRADIRLADAGGASATRSAAIRPRSSAASCCSLMIARSRCSRRGSARSTRRRSRRSSACKQPVGRVLVRHRHAGARRLQPRRLRRARLARRRASRSRCSASLIGLAIGLVTGFIRWLDAIVMRVMDGLMSIPPVLLAIALMALTKASIENVIVAITLAEVPRVVRLVRSLVLTLREQPYVEAAIAAGTSLPRILRAPHPAQHRRAAARAGDLRLRLGDDHRGDPLLHRRRHAAQHPELGQHHGRGAQPVPDRRLPDPASRASSCRSPCSR